MVLPLCGGYLAVPFDRGRLIAHVLGMLTGPKGTAVNPARPNHDRKAGLLIQNDSCPQDRFVRSG